MGVVFRQSAKNLVVVVMGALLGAFILWLSTKFLTKQQFGFTRNLTDYAVTASQVLLLGLNNMMAVYIHRYANDEKKRKLLLAVSLILPAVATVLFSVGYYFLKVWILRHFQPVDQPFMDRFFMWLPVYVALFIYVIILEQYLGSQLKVAVAAFMREVVVRIASIVLILLYAFGYIDFTVLVGGTVLSYLLPVTIFVFLSLRTPAFGLSFDFKAFTKKEYREMFHFSWYHFLLTLSILFMGYMGGILIPFYDQKGFSSVAVYSTASFFISFLLLPSKAMTPASFTVIAKAFAENDHAKAKDIFIRSSINILIPTIAIAVLICCNMQNVVMIIKNGYSEIIPVFLILFIGVLSSQVTGMNDQVLSIANYYKFNFYLSIVLMLVLFMMMRILIPRFGIYGAAWASTSTWVLFNTVKCIFVWRKLNMFPLSKNTLVVFAAGIAAFVAGYYFPHFLDQERHTYIRTFVDVALRSTVIVITYALLLLWLKPSQDLRDYIGQVKKNKRLF